MNDTFNTLPMDIQGLEYYKVIIPYAFREAKGIEAATKDIDDALADRLIGIENDDKLIELSGIKFVGHYDFNNLRVS